MKKDRQPSTSSLLRAHSRGSFARFLMESEECNGPVAFQKPRSIMYIICQVAIFCLRLVTPCSYAYLLLLLFYPISPEQFPFGWIGYMTLLCCTISEALFFPYFYYKFRQLNSPNDELPHLATDRASRIQLVHQCFEAMGHSAIGSDMSMEEHLQRAIEGWFLDQPIRKIHYGNLAAWTGWAFFSKDCNSMTAEELSTNEEIIEIIEKKIRWTFPPGFNPDVPALRLNLDPVFATQRPFIIYASIWIINACTHVILQHLLGFKLRHSFTTGSKSQFIYHRPGTYNTTSAASGKAGKEASNKHDGKVEELPIPIVFVHGIGIGFAHYLVIIAFLPHDRDVFLVEWPYVAMQMATKGPTPEESVAAVVSILQHNHHHRGACFVAHSLGTAIVSWMLHDNYGAQYVHSAVLLDPITFLLCDPKVASMFVYKDPNNALDLMMHFFFSRELFIANGLSRHFAWSYNVMFVEDMLNPYPCCRKHKHLTLPTSMKGYLTGNKSSPDFLSLANSSAYSSSASLFSSNSSRSSGFTSNASSSVNLVEDSSTMKNSTPTRRKPRGLFSRVIRSLLRSTGSAPSSEKLSSSTSTSSFTSGSSETNEEKNNRAILRKIRQKLRIISKNSKQQAMCLTGEIEDDDEAYDIPEELWDAEEEAYLRKRGEQEAFAREEHQHHHIDGEMEDDTDYGYNFDEEEEEREEETHTAALQKKHEMEKEGVSIRTDICSPSASSNPQQHITHKENWEHHHAHHTSIDFSIYLSAGDAIVPAPEVYRYLLYKQTQGFHNYEVFYGPGLHGEVTVHPTHLIAILQKIREKVMQTPDKFRYSKKKL